MDETNPTPDSYFTEKRGRRALSRTCLLALLLISLFIHGCALYSSAPTHKGGSGQGKPYTIRGKTYYPLTSGDGFVEEGVASWYGSDFHGKTKPAIALGSVDCEGRETEISTDLKDRIRK